MMMFLQCNVGQRVNYNSCMSCFMTIMITMEFSSGQFIVVITKQLVNGKLYPVLRGSVGSFIPTIYPF